MNLSTTQWVSWTAVAGGVLALIGFISLVMLFVVGEPFGTVNDLLSIPTALLMMPLIFALYRLHAPHQPWVALFALLAGVLGFVAAAAGSGLLVLGRINFTQSLVPGIGGFGLIGLWLLLNASLALAYGTLPRGVAWAGMAVGAPATLALLAVFRVEGVALGLQATSGQTAAGMQTSPLIMAFVAFGALSYAAMPLLYIMMGRLFLSRQVAAVSAVAA